jgi:predicted Zn-dependent protease
VVSKADSLKSASTRDNGATAYRQVTEGLIWGDNFQEKEPKPERYSNMSWRVRIDFPEGWTHKLDGQGRTVIAEPESKDASLSMLPTARTAQSPEEFLYNHLNVSQLREGKEISPAGLKGFTGILPGEDGKPDRRIAVVYYKLTAYIFAGESSEAKNFSENDTLFMASIATFRPISKREIEGQSPKKIHYVKATSATTFEALGQALKLNPYELEDLRMINGYYPAGEPKPGEWIKIFRQ